MSLDLVPIDREIAKAFVATWHRHNAPPISHKFSIGVAADDLLVGVIMVGRPVARHYQDGSTLEVTRCCTDGTPNAASLLYGAAWRATKALGYRRLITYTRADEPGSSLRAAGWRIVGERPATAGWSRPSRPRDETGYESIPRTLWEATP